MPSAAALLEASNYGIICVTADNVAAPWLNFEAGALSKLFEKSRVSPFLFGIGKNDVAGPMKQFQSTVYEQDDMLKLVASINNACVKPLGRDRLEEAFEIWWPKLQTRMGHLEIFPRTRVRPRLLTQELRIF